MTPDDDPRIQSALTLCREQALRLAKVLTMTRDLFLDVAAGDAAVTPAQARDLAEAVGPAIEEAYSNVRKLSRSLAIDHVESPPHVM
jgi:hypothetical protein